MNDYDLAKLLMNQDGFKEELRKISDNQCYMEQLIKKNSPVIFKALFSNHTIIVPEYHQMLIFVKIIEAFIAKENDLFADAYKFCFGSCCPKYLLRGRGDQLSTRQMELSDLQDKFQ
jgi:hypothetical protein